MSNNSHLLPIAYQSSSVGRLARGSRRTLYLLFQAFVKRYVQQNCGLPAALLTPHVGKPVPVLVQGVLPEEIDPLAVLKHILSPYLIPSFSEFYLFTNVMIGTSKKKFTELSDKNNKNYTSNRINSRSPTIVWYNSGNRTCTCFAYGCI